MAGFSSSTYVLCRAYTDSQVKDVIGTMAEGMTFKGHVPTQADLPSSHVNGDLWIIDDINPGAPGDQSAKAVWDSNSAKWVIFDAIPVKVSQLENDEFFLSQKVNGTSYVDNIHIDGTKKTHTATTTNPHEYIISDIQFNRGNFSTLASYVPKYGEPVFEYDGTYYKLKIGDGSRTFASLPYIGYQYELSSDERSVHIQGSQLQIYGFATAVNGLIPRKKSGSLQWVKANDFIRFVEGKAIDITETVGADNTVTEKIDDKYDNSTIKVNTSNELIVPVDHSTIYVSGGQVKARQPVAGDQSIKVEEIAGETKITGNYKAGANITLTPKSDGVYIESTGGGGAGNIEAGTAIKFTSNPTTGATIINADYDAGDYIQIKTEGGRTSINVDPTAVENTLRQIKVDGTEILGTNPNSGYLGLQSGDQTSGVGLSTISTTGGKTVKFEVSNKNILHSQMQGTGKRVLKNLENKVVVFNCGNANFGV